MIIPPGILTLEKVYDLADDPRYLDTEHPERDPYAALVDRLFEGHLAPEIWPPPPPNTLGREVAPVASVGVGGENRPQDVAEVTEGLRAVNGLGLGGWLRPSGVPTPEFNAAILGFQRAQGLKPDGVMQPDGLTLMALNQQFQQPLNTEAGALNPAAYGGAGPGRPITAGGLAEEQRADGSALQASDPFAEGRGRYPQAVVDNVDRLLAPEPKEIPAGTLDDFEAQGFAGLDSDSMMTKVGYRPNGQAVFGPMGVPGEVFRKMIADRERSYVPGQNPRAFGEYQLTIGALQDVKMMDTKENWTGKWDIWSVEDYFKNLDVQNMAFTEYMGLTELYLHEVGDFDAFDYRGQEIAGIAAHFRITPAGIMAAAHRQGHAKVRAYIRHLERRNWISSLDGLRVLVDRI